MTSSKPNCLLKSPSPNTITLGVEIATYEFWVDTIQSIALSKKGVSLSYFYVKKQNKTKQKPIAFKTAF